MDDAVTLTHQMIQRAGNNGGYTTEQLRVVGLEWPPVKGWKRRLVGMRLPLKDWRVFMKYPEPDPISDKKGRGLRDNTDLKRAATELAIQAWIVRGGTSGRDASVRCRIAINAVTRALMELADDFDEMSGESPLTFTIVGRDFHRLRDEFVRSGGDTEACPFDG